MARLGGVGDRVIVMAFASMTPEEARGYRPSVVALDERNRIVERLEYPPIADADACSTSRNNAPRTGR